MIPPHDVTLAAAAYPIEVLADRDAVARKLDRWVEDAIGADILVFPEYAGMEVALTQAEGLSISGWCIAAADSAGWYLEQLRWLAAKHGRYVLGGSCPVRTEGGLVNRAYLVGPEGPVGWQDKLVLTPWERANTPLQPGAGLHPFNTAFGSVGALICYDSEFPLLCRALACDIVLVPACTDTKAGDHRVSAASRARALENQSVIIHAPLLGAVPACPLIDENHGRAGIYAAPDRGWPADGVLAQGGRDQPGWTMATLVAGSIGAAREKAAVAVPNHWRETETIDVADPSRL